MEVLRIAALLHDIGRLEQDASGGTVCHAEKGAEMAAERARLLSLSNDEIARMTAVIKNHMRIHFHTSRKDGEGKDPSRRAIYRFFRDSGEAGVDLILLALADLRATHGNNLKQETWTAALDVCRIFLENYWERPDEVVAPPRLIDGNDVMRELNLKLFKEQGLISEEVFEQQMNML